jgi:RNA polymerase sigma-70 factor, ECF subfamily
MADLEAAFRTELAARAAEGDANRRGAPDASELAALCARGRAAFPELKLDDEAFVRHVARCVAAAGDAAQPPASLAIEDLYLACACAAGAAGAVAQFDALCGAAIRAALATMAGTPVERDEVEQQLRIDLLVGGGAVPPRIATFRGQAPLTRWVAVATRRLAISMLRAEDAEERARERAAVDEHMPWRDPALALARQRYLPDFQWALEQAITRVGSRERLLLRLHLVKGVTTRRLASMYRVSQPTASRWLEQARQRVLHEMQQLLRERLALRPADIESLAALLKSQLDLSLSRLLQTR